MSKRRVVVTGLGAITPVGNDVQTAWDSIVAGKSGIGPITQFDVSAYTTRFGGAVKDFDITEYLSPKESASATSPSISSNFNHAALPVTNELTAAALMA